MLPTSLFKELLANGPVLLASSLGLLVLLFPMWAALLWLWVTSPAVVLLLATFPVVLFSLATVPTLFCWFIYRLLGVFLHTLKTLVTAYGLGWSTFVKIVKSGNELLALLVLHFVVGRTVSQRLAPVMPPIHWMSGVLVAFVLAAIACPVIAFLTTYIKGVLCLQSDTRLIATGVLLAAERLAISVLNNMAEQQARSARASIGMRRAPRLVLDGPDGVSAATPQNRCVICYEDEPIYAIVECGHLALCGVCVRRDVRKCPICRGRIDRFLRIWTVESS